MITEQTTPFGQGSVKIQDPDDSFGDIGLVKNLQETFPQYRGINPHHLKKSLIVDDEFRQTVGDQWFELSVPDEVKTLRQEDPEQYQEAKRRFQNGFLKDLTDTSYTGTTKKETLVNRSLSLSKGIEDLPITDYKTIVEQNPKNYESWGLVGSDGTVLFGDDSPSNAAISQKIIENEDLHKQLILDRYKQFERELAKGHNPAEIVKGDMGNLTQAWVVFDKFGPEGLTQFMNYLQFKDAPNEDTPIGQRFQQGQEALNFLQTQQIEGKSLGDFVDEFVTGKRVQNIDRSEDINNRSFENDISPALLAGMIRQESNFNPTAVSSVGAAGISQFMPATAKEMGLQVPDELVELDRRRISLSGEGRHTEAEQVASQIRALSLQYKDRPEEDERFNPELSVDAGARLLGKHMKAFEYDPQKAVAAFNAGAGRVRQAERDSLQNGGTWLEYMPRETRRHVPLVDRYKEEYGETIPLIHEPIKPRKDLTKDVPRDLNYFTANFYRSTQDGAESRDSFAVTKEFLDRYVDDTHKGHIQAEDLKKYGAYSNDYKHVTWNIWESALNQNDGYTVEDLVDTVLANATHRTEDGRSVYTFNYDRLPSSAKIAADALYHDPEMSRMFLRTPRENEFDFRPGVHEESFDFWKRWRNRLMSTKTVSEQDEEGRTTFKEVPESGLVSSVWNIIAGTGLAVAHTLYKFAYEPAVRWTAMGMDEQPGLAYSDNVRNRAQASIFDVILGEDEPGSGGGLAMVGDMAQYMGAMYGSGRALLGLGTKGLQAITGVKKTTDLIKYTSSMPGSGRLAGMGLKLQSAVRNKHPWATGVGIFYSGGAYVEATQPPETSFYNLIPEVLGYEPTNDARKLYHMADSKTKWAMDIGASLMFDSVADGILASSKFLTAKTAQKFFGRDKFKSLKYNETDKIYEVVDAPQFRSDFREFWTNLTSDLADMPLGNIGSDFAETTLPRSGIKTVDGFVKAFVDETGDVATNIRQDISDHVRWINREMGDGLLDENQLRQLETDSYNTFIQRSAEKITGVLGTQGEELPLRFAQALEATPSRVKEFKPDGEVINPKQLHRWKAQGYNVYAKNGKIFQIEPEFWAIDLSNVVKAQTLKKNIDEVLERRLREEGLPTDPTNMTEAQLARYTELYSETRNTIGATVRTADDQIGYISDFDSNGFVVKSEDGRVSRVETTERLSREEAQRIERATAARRGDVADDALSNLKREIDEAVFNRLTDESAVRYQQKFMDVARRSYNLARSKNQLPFC